MNDQLATGLIVAVVSMLGTLLALSFIALMIYILHRALPDSESQVPSPKSKVEDAQS